MSMSSEVKAVIQSIFESATRSEYDGETERSWKLAAVGDVIMHEYKGHGASSYIHEYWSETTSFPKRILEELVSSALSSGESTVQIAAHLSRREWSEDTYVTFGEDRDNREEKDIEILLKLTLSEDGPRFVIEPISSTR